jgi:hypothetical protein
MQTVTPKYLMNQDTNEIYAFSEALLANKSPRFAPYLGTLPPIDFKTGTRVFKQAPVIAVQTVEVLTPEQRIEQLAAIVHLVPPDDISDSGLPSIPVIEKLSGLTGVKRPEVKLAMKLRADTLRSKNRISNPPLPEVIEGEETSEIEEYA